MKQCSKCKRVLELGYFNRDSKSNDGRQRWCKSCVAKYKAEYQHTRKEYNATYYQTKIYKAKSIKRQTERRMSGCLKVTARDLLHKAMTSGKITKPSICSQCGTEYKDKRVIHGHHPDYTLPYNVQWLCRQCHIDVHKELARGTINDMALPVS